MKRPAFQFYPADWRNNAKLRRCSEAARGAWIDLMCLLHDSDEYGVLRWPLMDVSRALGVPIKLLKELASKGVLKGGDNVVGPYVYTPRHGGKDGEPVTLIKANDGPCWYCSRFVRDEHIREVRGSGTRFGDNNPPPKATPKAPPKPPPNVTPMPPIGDAKGYGASASSSINHGLEVTTVPSSNSAPESNVKTMGHRAPESQNQQPWHKTEKGTVAKGLEFGIQGRPGETWEQLKRRVWDAEAAVHRGKTA